MFPLQFPYFVEPQTLPRPLPTLDEIESSEDILNEAGGSKVVVVGPYVVKFGPQVDLAEGENMLFVAHNTSVPVPRVYALFRDSQDPENGYIIMERIMANTLQSEWPSLSNKQKEAITSKLGSLLKELRSLPSPGGYCSLGNSPLLEAIFWTDRLSEKFNGPFRTEEEFNTAMLKIYLYNKGSPIKAQFYKRTLPSIFRNHPPIFTHCDFQRKNILLRSVGDTENDIDIIILDWEFSGWYPAHWEYFKAMLASGGWRDDWGLWVDSIFEPELYLTEWVWMNMLVVELWS